MDAPDTSAIGKSQAIHGSARSTSGFRASGTAEHVLEQIAADEIEQDRSDEAEAKIEQYRRQQHARSIGLGSVRNFDSALVDARERPRSRKPK